MTFEWGLLKADLIAAEFDLARYRVALERIAACGPAVPAEVVVDIARSVLAVEKETP